ncbi:MAG TPA: hypothetical protein VGU20_14260 [Stellaceae bacterium]|nr:hypothetical protein [Stellaceae bacterium]
MRRALIWAVDLAFVANGLFMVVAPAAWYGFIPGVANSGPFNPHFVRDIGCAYLVAGGGLLWFAFDGRARAAAVIAAGFLTLHALVHLLDWAADRESLMQLAIDAPTVLVPGAFIFKIARPGSAFFKERTYDQMAAAAAPRRIRTEL